MPAGLAFAWFFVSFSLALLIKVLHLIFAHAKLKSVKILMKNIKNTLRAETLPSTNFREKKKIHKILT